MTPLQAAAANFSTLVKPKNFRPMQIDSFKVDDDSFAIDIRLNTQVHIPYTLDTTLSHFHDVLLGSSGVENVNFFSISGSVLPLCEKIGNQREYPVLLQVNNDRLFAINFSQEYQIAESAKRMNRIYEEEEYFYYAQDLGFSGFELFHLPKYS